MYNILITLSWPKPYRSQTNYLPFAIVIASFVPTATMIIQFNKMTTPKQG